MRDVIYKSLSKIIDFELDGKETSQKMFDIYSFSHITHGIIFYFILNYFNYTVNKIFIISFFIEIIWEWFENTSFIIKKYRKNPNFEHYQGDSKINIIGDIIFMVFGLILCLISPYVAIAYVIISEIILYKFKANLLYLSIGNLIK